jgi:hypothetical protein
VKTANGKITFQEFLKILRPDLRPSLAKKELLRFLHHLKRLEIFDDYERHGKSIEARRRIMAILDTPEYVSVENPVNADDPDDHIAHGGNFWDLWDSRYGSHPSRESDHAALKSFWAHWGTSLDDVEAQVRHRALAEFEEYSEEGVHPAMNQWLKGEYDKWRLAETSLARGFAAKAKAAQAPAKKAEGKRIKIEQKEARKKNPHVTKYVNFENELERQSFEKWKEETSKSAGADQSEED